MFKIFSKLPRKSTKPDSPESCMTESSCSSDQSSNGSSFPGKGNVIKRTPSAVFSSTVMEPLVSFKDVPSTEKMNLFISKLSLCCMTFDFSNSSKNSMEKEVKRQTLIELVEFVASGTMRFSEPAIFAMCKMCAVNLFRVFPPNYRGKNIAGEKDDDEPMFNPAWSHLNIVYELLLKFVNSQCVDLKLAKRYIDHCFILSLLDLFDSEDPRERDCLKALLHRIYGKFMVHRPFIRKSICNVFYRFVFETEKHNGIAELLEVFGSIICGFTLPLKEEHKIFLRRALIPLHKPRCLGVYFQQLSYCIMQFVEKEPRVASMVINGLLRYWPVTNSQKEVMFLGEIEEILEVINLAEFQNIMVPLFWRIGYCINSCHFQVAERSLFLWNNDLIVNLIAHNRHMIFPIICPALEKNAQNHWNYQVLNLTLSIRKMLSEMDGMLFLSCHARYIEEEEQLRLAAEKRKEAWDRLENAASLQPIAGNTAVLVSPLATSIAC